MNCKQVEVTLLAREKPLVNHPRESVPIIAGKTFVVESTRVVPTHANPLSLFKRDDRHQDGRDITESSLMKYELRRVLVKRRSIFSQVVGKSEYWLFRAAALRANKQQDIMRITQTEPRTHGPIHGSEDGQSQAEE